MLKTVTVTAAAMGMLFCGALGLVTMPLLLRVQRAHRSFLAQQNNAHPLEDAKMQTARDIPALGGGVLWIGCCAALLFAWSLAAETLSENGYSDGWSHAAMLIAGSLPLGLVGMADDCLHIFRRDGRGMTALLRLALQLLSAGAMLAILYRSGDTSSLVHLFGRWIDLGVWYWPLSALVIVIIARSAAVCAKTDGLTAGSGFIVSLAFLIIGMLMLEIDLPNERFVTALYAAALAGGCIGFMLWNFYPAKIGIGSAGAQYLAAGLAMIAWNLGRPELLVISTLPWLVSGFYLVLQLLLKKQPAQPLNEALNEKYQSPVAVTGLFCGIGCLGALLAVLQVWFTV